MRIVVLTGGIGGARFLLGVRAHAREIGAEVTAVVNVGDDVRLHGLQICPDLDSVMYTLGGAADPERGWGRVGETWTVKEELAAYGAEPTWFGLGDKDIATHLVRTTMLNAGYPLSRGHRGAVRRAGSRAYACCRPPTTGWRRTPSSTSTASARRSTSRSGGCATGPTCPPTGSSSSAPRRRSRPPGVLEAIAAADVVLIAPSNPVVSIAPVLAVAAIREALTERPGPGGRGLADHRRRPGPRHGRQVPGRARRRVQRGRGGRPLRRPAAGGLLDGWLVDAADAGTVVPGRARSARCRCG